MFRSLRHHNDKPGLLWRLSPVEAFGLWEPFDPDLYNLQSELETSPMEML